jgi:hypothetical protein
MLGAGFLDFENFLVPCYWNSAVLDGIALML